MKQYLVPWIVAMAVALLPLNAQALRIDSTYFAQAQKQKEKQKLKAYDGSTCKKGKKGAACRRRAVVQVTPSVPVVQDVIQPQDTTPAIQVDEPVNVPEPGTLALLAFGLLGSGLARRRRR